MIITNQIDIERDPVIGPYWRTLSPRVRGELLNCDTYISTIGEFKQIAEHFRQQEEAEKGSASQRRQTRRRAENEERL